MQSFFGIPIRLRMHAKAFRKPRWFFPPSLHFESIGHFENISKTFRTHSENTPKTNPKTFRKQSERVADIMPKTFGTHSQITPKPFRKYFKNAPNAFRNHCENISKTARRILKTVRNRSDRGGQGKPTTNQRQGECIKRGPENAFGHVFVRTQFRYQVIGQNCAESTC